MAAMKQFYSCVDVLLPAPFPEQHELSKKKAVKEGGQIIFYGSEEYRVAKQQPFILGKLLRTPRIDGVVFFSIDQFCYGDKFNLKLLRDILRLNLSVHFAREDMSFDNIDDVEKVFITLTAYFHAFKRRRTMSADDVLRAIA
jgi:hypothetical protein